MNIMSLHLGEDLLSDSRLLLVGSLSNWA